MIEIDPKALPDKPGDKKLWHTLPGLAQVAATASAALASSDATLVITPGMTQADRIARDLRLYLKDHPNAPPVLQFADWETLPYDTFSPHQDIISDRMRCLYQLASGKRALVVVAATTLTQRLAPAEYILANSLILETGSALDRESFIDKLTRFGYQRVDTVFNHGELAVRGALIDVFPMGSRAAYRIELFDDEVESLRQFDPETQRTIEQVDSIELLPAKECPLDPDSIQRFKQNWYARFDVDHRSCPVFQDVSSGISPAGVEYYLPLFFDSTATLFDYVDERTRVFMIGSIEAAIEDFWREAESRYETHNIDAYRPLLEPPEVFVPVNQLFSKLKALPRAQLTDQPRDSGLSPAEFAEAPDLSADSRASQPLIKLEAFLMDYDGRVLFCAESNGRREALREHFQRIGIDPVDCDTPSAFFRGDWEYGITVADFQQGFICLSPRLALISEAQLFGERVQQYRRRKQSDQAQQENIVKNLTELKVGAAVVHIEHGVGRYRGLQTIDHGGQAEEFLVLEYADEAKLYVPVTNLHLISRYSGAEEGLAPWHRLGSEQWQKAKRKAAEKLRDVAAELLEIYARRQAREGYQYDFPKDAYKRFAASFPFEETADQDAAIEAVRADMLSEQPMDRLVCGDVGFGKTEVAMRAAFIAVENSKQVAVLVPTTLLAQQHYDNFRDRFADWPVNIEVISRFRSTADIQKVQKKLETGQVDILIGTHKLLQGELSFPDLGLLIIDEEHRFGVRQKEALKALRAEVDILTLTATPIPRTLNMSMSGIRDLSIIATPPAKRLSVKTFVRQSDNGIIKEAILREIMRGGQVYYLHNEVRTIDQTARHIQELVPEARIRIAHGQMRERELEAAMSDFYHKRYNILVCTTIIETGIDIPSANTIIIDRADKFGLAQLHQLRGRVGRSHHQAYAYMLTPHRKAMTGDAIKRLEAIAEAQDLGAGFTLASHDLEIRGAGELLGEEQSGQMQAIGFSLYMEMLDKAVKAMKAGEELDWDNSVQPSVEINLRIPALIPEEYLPDVHSRVILYKRLASVEDDEQLNDLQVEMIDRFGLLPDPVKNLVRQTRLRLIAEQLGIIKVEANDQGGRIEFAQKPKVEPLTIVKLVQNTPQHYRMEGASQLKFFFDMPSADERLKTVHHVFESLQKTS